MIDINAIAQTAAVEADLTKVQAFKESEPLAEGPCRLRLLSYIELGLHPGTKQFPKPKEKAKVVFEVVSKKHLEKDSEGKTVHRTITVYFNKGTSAKAGDRKLFNAMNASVGNIYTHFAEMIGKGFAAKITNSVPVAPATAVYSNLDEGPRDASTYTFTPPFKIDEDGEFVLTEDGARIPVEMPELRGKPQLFLWEMDALSDEQIIAMWDDLYIEGEWEAKEAQDGKPARPAKSKNVIQEKIMAGVSWEGSRTEGLTQTFVELDELTGEPVEGDDDQTTETTTEAATTTNPAVAGLANMVPEKVTKEVAKEADVVADIVEIPGLD